MSFRPLAGSPVSVFLLLCKILQHSVHGPIAIRQGEFKGAICGYQYSHSVVSRSWTLMVSIQLQRRNTSSQDGETPRRLRTRASGAIMKSSVSWTPICSGGAASKPRLEASAVLIVNACNPWVGNSSRCFGFCGALAHVLSGGSLQGMPTSDKAKARTSCARLCISQTWQAILSRVANVWCKQNCAPLSPEQFPPKTAFYDQASSPIT